MTDKHLPVMAREALAAWLTREDGVYVDGTYGRGGHSGLMLQRLTGSGRLFAFDKDPRAVASGRLLEDDHPNFKMCHSAFSDMFSVLAEQGVAGKVSGIFLDLGVSSPQLDTADRGFSFMRDGDLDMRMDTSTGLTAAQWLAEADVQSIAGVLRRFGEEPYAKRIAEAIVNRRASSPLERTVDLAKLIESVVPMRVKAKSKTHPATKSFQAIRLHVNDELGEVQRFLDRCLDVLCPGGRIVVISFHSLEDRLVKRFMRDGARGREGLSGIPLTENQMARSLRLVGPAQKAQPAEVDRNPRSRSAVMRVAEKL